MSSAACSAEIRSSRRSCSPIECCCWLIRTMPAWWRPSRIHWPCSWMKSPRLAENNARPSAEAWSRCEPSLCPYIPASYGATASDLRPAATESGLGRLCRRRNRTAAASRSMTIVFCRRLFESRVLRGDQRIHRAFVEEVIRQCRMDLPECDPIQLGNYLTGCAAAPLQCYHRRH